MTRTLAEVLATARRALLNSGASDLEWTLADVISARRTRSGLVVGELGWRGRRVRFVCVDRAVTGRLHQHGTGWRAGLSGQFALRLVIHPRFGFQAEVYDVATETLDTATSAHKRDQLQVRIAAEGWTRRQRALPDPGLPGQVAVVTSPDSQGLADFLTTVPEVCHPTVVEASMGDGAARSVAAAIQRAATGDTDLVVVLRGGGPASGMGWGNDERVVEAIATAATPVWTAVGHADDTHLIDQVAQMSFATPTQAAAELRRRADLATATAREQVLRREREAARQQASEATGQATTARRVAAAAGLAAALVVLGVLYWLLARGGL